MREGIQGWGWQCSHRAPPAYLLCQGLGKGSKVGLCCSVHWVVDIRRNRLCPPKPGHCLERRGSVRNGCRMPWDAPWFLGMGEGEHSHGRKVIRQAGASFVHLLWHFNLQRRQSQCSDGHPSVAQTTLPWPQFPQSSQHVGYPACCSRCLHPHKYLPCFLKK